MKAFALSLALVACAGAGATVAPPAKPPATGMHRYFLALLRRGPTWSPQKTPESVRLSEGHMANIHAMAAAGKLVVAGPFDTPDVDTRALAGIFIFDVPTLEEAQGLVDGDPAVRAGRFTVEILPWWSTEGLGYGASRR
jgi:uncharacterized protein YciI